MKRMPGLLTLEMMVREPAQLVVDDPSQAP